MKKILTVLLVSFSWMLVNAQERDLLDIDLNLIDSIFDKPLAESTAEKPAKTTSQPPVKTTPVISEVNRRGIIFSASYNFKLSTNPGWGFETKDEEGKLIDYIGIYPWDLKGDDNEHFSWAFGVEAGATISINAQISNYFRVMSVFSYGIPGFTLSIGDFYFDYNILNYVYLRAGKVEQSWGVSPNFAFTNLLSRIATRNDPNYPNNYDPAAPSTSGPSYLIKLDVPIGIGGAQLVALTRVNLAGGIIPTRNYIGYGGKFNLAFKWADFNLGAFYQDFMATRAYFSAKTSVFKFDIYNEWLVGVNTHSDNSVGFAVNLGISRSFLKDKLKINAEYFYNGEESTKYYSPETDIREEEVLPFLEGHNFAFSVGYKFDGKINPRVFANFLYGDDSYSLTIGARITLLSFIDIYLAVPMAFGEGHYYQTLTNIKSEHRPFSVMLFVNINGSVSASRFY